jgi:hypothetical protein
MHTRLARSFTAAFVFAGLAAAQTPARPAYRAPRYGTTRQPNLNGIWQAMNSANWNIEAHAAGPSVVSSLGAAFAVPPGIGVVDGGEIPYLPAAAAKRKENFANRAKLDPEAKCYLPGVPRATYNGHPFQILQGGGDKLVIAYQYAAGTRTVNMAKPTESPSNFWMGWSNGKWEGDTLVIDVTGQVGDTWFDRAGNHHSDEIHVVERFTPRSADVLWYEATIEDPKTYSKPWKIAMPLYRHVEPNAQLLEFKCMEFAEEMMYGHLFKKGASK